MNNWWKDYFLDAWPKIQHFIKGEENTYLETNYIEGILEEKKYKHILDVPCGTGRIALELAERGYTTCGLDFNKKNIEEAQKSSVQKELPQQTEWICGDMREIPFKNTFDAAVCIFGSFGYFDDIDNRKFLQSVYDSLKPGGSFLLETHTLETMLPIFTHQDFWRFEDCWVLDERNFNIPESRIESTWTTIQDGGQQLQHKSSVRIYSYRELTTLLKSVGFKHFSAEGSFEAEEFELGAERLLLLAEK
ncbi:MAG: class I SAM-dependent methyltransferase [Chitinophagales bacterium]